MNSNMAIELPELPVPIADFVQYVDKHPKSQRGVAEAVKPYLAFESKLRQIYAQQPHHSAASVNHLVPVFNDREILTRARDLSKETQAEKDAFLLPLADDMRRENNSPATVGSLKEFRTNFNLFSESSLMDLDWSNVVAAGSAVNTSLLPVHAPHNESKRALRNYYHEILAPASDVDLFLYGLNEEQAIEKIKQIESRIRDSILSETTTVRTKNAITIVSQYPTRHVQLVLRLYKSVSEILTGFDVDCSCVAYDGEQVWASPRAVASLMTQVNTIDLTRRSPSYENRLSKYSHRGFEAFWPAIDRDRIDPTIFERSFSRVQGLARLLVLEKLPHPNDRDQYLAKRREERGRPPVHWNQRNSHQLPGNLKDTQPDDVAEWVEEDEVSNYHTVTIPYGPKYNAKRVEKLLFTKDLLLNAEWNKPKDREAKLHRHPAFFGSVNDVIHDCCGFCPEATTDADLAALEDESKTFISGEVTFLKDDPGRQAIGSFNPITDVDWTEMAYIGNTTRLCQAIVDQDVEAVRDWFSSPQVVEVDRRDHAGRTPLQLATMCSSAEIVQILIEHGARIVSRLYNGMTALHIAAHRGETQMVRDLLEKSAANEVEEARKEESRKIARRTTSRPDGSTADLHEAQASAADNVDVGDLGDDNDDWEVDGTEEPNDDNDESDETSNPDSVTEGSFVKINRNTELPDPLAEGKDDPDVYDIDVLAWDNPLSPLHLAILAGHIDVIEMLIDEFGADALLPVKIMDDYDRKNAKAAILTIVLALELPLQQANRTVQSLLSRGVTPTQADMNHISAVHFTVNSTKVLILDTLQAADPVAVAKACNFVAASGWGTNPTVTAPILTAIRTGNVDMVQKLISLGANLEIDFGSFAEAHKRGCRYPSEDKDEVRKIFQRSVEQPIIAAAKMEMVDIVNYAIQQGVDVNTISAAGWRAIDYSYGDSHDYSLLDIVSARIATLREELQPVTKHSKPEELDKISGNIKYDKDTYRYWTAYHDLEDARAIKRFQLDSFTQKVEHQPSSEEDGSTARKSAIESVLLKLIDLEKTLLSKGAKSFKILHPEAKLETYSSYRRYNRFKSTPYETNISFNLSDLTPEKEANYIRLFEACWKGDSDEVRSLCLSQHRPLQVAVTDLHGFSPYSISTLRGHFDLARLVVEIATAQYQPKDQKDKYKYSLRIEAHGLDSDDDSDSDESQSSDLGVLSHLVKDNFTVDDVAALADTVKSEIAPTTLIEWPCQVVRALETNTDNKDARSYFSRASIPGGWIDNHAVESWEWFNTSYDHVSKIERDSLVRYAIFTNNLSLLRFLIKIGNDVASTKPDGDVIKVFNVSAGDFKLAIRLGRVEMVGEIIKSTGFGFPLKKIFMQSGVKLEHKPDYYQGLTVHGRKREDWAEAGRRGHRYSQNSSDIGIPLLASALEGNLESVEYFLSDAPLRRYTEFASAFKDDKHLRALEQADGGIEGALRTWLSTRSQLVLHAGVLSAPNEDGSQPVFEYLLQKTPHSLETRSADGQTPLQLAFEVGRYHAARELITAGANQATKDDKGRNVVHSILAACETKDHKLVKSLLDLLDSQLISSLFLERCSDTDFGATTPLALFLDRCNSDDAAEWQQTLNTILSYSGGKDLEKLNGAGDYPLHRAVRANNLKLVEFLVEYRPGLLYWENATGMTPADVASTAYLRSNIDQPPELTTTESWSIKDQTIKDFIKAPDAKAWGSGFLNSDSKRRVQWKMHYLIKSLMQKYPSKRKLVSLFDANEVAKRLAVMQQKRNEEEKRKQRLGIRARNEWRDMNDVDPEELSKDEIAEYLFAAKGFTKWDQVKWRHEVLNEPLETARELVLNDNEPNWRDVGKNESRASSEKSTSQDLGMRTKSQTASG